MLTNCDLKKTFVTFLEQKALNITDEVSHQGSSIIIKCFWVGVLIRVLVMPFSGHADFYYTFAFTYPFFTEGVLDPYAYQSQFPGYVAFYQPLAYYLIGIWTGLIELIVGNEQSQWIFSMWENVANRDAAKILGFPGAENKFLLIFSWKLLLLLADFFLVFLLMRRKKQSGEQRVFLIKLWAFNPILLYAVFMMGQIDLLPTVIMLAALIVYQQTSNLKWSAMVMACAVPFKFFPLILLPFFVLSGKDWKERWCIAIYAALPLLALYVPIAIHSHGKVFVTLQYALQSGSSRLLVFEQLAVVLLVFKVVVYCLLALHAAGVGENHVPSDLIESYVFISLLLLLIVPAVVHYYVWVAPFLMLFMARNLRFRKACYLLMLLIFVSAVSGRSLSLGLFAPLHPEFFMSLPGWMDINYALFPSKIVTKISYVLQALIIFWIVISEVSRILRDYPSTMLPAGYFRKIGT